MKYSFIFPYWMRANQLRNTLLSFRHWYHDRDDFEVIVIEDSKSTDDLRGVVDEFAEHGHRRIPIVILKTGRADGFNPSIAFNVGVNAAQGEYVVITNPECLHKTNVLGVFDEVFTEQPGSYVVAACESIKGADPVFHYPATFNYVHHMWYQHTTAGGEGRNLRYHFCSALSRQNYLLVGGFDERYAEGIGYDDDAFRDRVERAGIPFVMRDDAMALHQQHTKLSAVLNRGLLRQLTNKNRMLYESELVT